MTVNEHIKEWDNVKENETVNIFYFVNIFDAVNMFVCAGMKTISSCLNFGWKFFLIAYLISKSEENTV